MTSSTAAIHVAKKQLGLDDDTYRAKLVRITGKPSTKDMTEAERQRVLQVLRNEGFQPAAAARRPDGRQKLTGKYAGKLQALWIAAWNLGIVRDRDDAALISFVKGQTKIDHVRFVHNAADARAVIEALKAWIAREGGVDWSGEEDDGRKIARAQWAILSPSPRDFWPVVTDLVDLDETHCDLSDRQWISVMNYFGRDVRAARKADK